MKLSSDYFWKLIRDYSVKALLKRLGFAMSGFWGFVTVTVVEAVMNKYLKPMWDFAYNRAIFKKEEKEGKERAKRKRQAKSPSDYLNELNRK